MASKDHGIIVVGVDGSEESVAALEWAVAEARLREAKVEAIMALDTPWTIMFSGSYTESDYAEDARKLLDETVSGVIAKHPDVTITQSFVPRKPGLALIEAAQEADLLVVGSHGPGAIPGMHLGSVANFCVNRSPIPVVVHRTPEK
ncbi:MAG TPA: universal stress protein [Microbacteriaceae bacterium]|nr:universal stress protein [Microbacteriaceae bacterium]